MENFPVKENVSPSSLSSQSTENQLHDEKGIYNESTQCEVETSKDSLVSTSKINSSEKYVKDHDSMVESLLPHSANLYSGISDLIVSGSIYDNDEGEDDSSSSSPRIDEEDINNHLKGTLTFGLPSKSGGGLAFNRPYKFMRKSKVFFRGKPRNSKTKKLVENNKKNHLSKKIMKLMDSDNIDHLSDEMKLAYRIVTHLMCDNLKSFNSIFLETIELDPAINGDYLEVVKEPIWLPKIKEKLLANEYKSIAEVVGQIRLMFENTYRYFGAMHSFTKRGLRLEYVLEQRLAQLPEDKRIQCTLKVTEDAQQVDSSEKTRTKGCCVKINNGDAYFSQLLYNVRGCRSAREKELRKKKVDMMRLAKQSREVELTQWEENLTGGTLGGPVKHMWELVYINHFLCLSVKILNISLISQYEFERMLMIPESSMTLRMVMTSLLIPKQLRSKLSEKPFMPYSIWVRKLASKTVYWYRMYVKESQDTLKLRDQIGIEPKFWQVCGEKNPFDFKLFHEMTLYQRVWLLKTLCDHIYHTHKSVQENMTEQDEESLVLMREEVLGQDQHGFEYIHFPYLKNTDIRIYKRVRFHCTFNDAFPGNEIGEEEVNVPLFSKDEVKSFQKFIKKLKNKKRNMDDDWEKEVSRYKNTFRRKKNRRSPYIPSTPSTSTTSPRESHQPRSRPRWLRQTPKPRYSLQMDDSDSEGRTISPHPLSSQLGFLKKRGKGGGNSISSTPSPSPVASSFQDESDVDEGFKEESDLDSDDPAETEGGEKLQRNAKERPPRNKATSNRLKFHCEICGKVFSSKAAKFGHSAMHTKKKDKISSNKSTSKTANKSSKISEEFGNNRRDIQQDLCEENSEIKNLELPIKFESHILDPSKESEINVHHDEKMEFINKCDKGVEIDNKDLKKSPDVQETESKDLQGKRSTFDEMRNKELEEENSEKETKFENDELGLIKEGNTSSLELYVASSRTDHEKENESCNSKMSVQIINASNLQQAKRDCTENKSEIKLKGRGEEPISKHNKIDVSSVKTENREIATSSDLLPFDKERLTTEDGVMNRNGNCVKIENEQESEKEEIDVKGVVSGDVIKEEKLLEYDEIVNENQASDKKSKLDVNELNYEQHITTVAPKYEEQGIQESASVDEKVNSRVSTPSDDFCMEPSNDRTSSKESSSKGPDMEEFELVASSFSELRSLILQFGDLPSKCAMAKGNEEELGSEINEEGKADDEDNEERIEDNNIEGRVKGKKLAKCEERLHKALCRLLIDWAPHESKMNSAQKQIKRKLWNEFLEWSKRDDSIVDPAEEAWNSDPEPEPAPPPSSILTPKPSSSSSSEETYHEDGTRKRKLRKRKVKRITIEQDSRSPSPDMYVPSPPSPSEGKVAVSSRGRIRKVKHILNYDRLDFEKLAAQAEKEAMIERDKKRKRKDNNDGVVDELVRLQELREKMRFEKKEVKVNLSKTNDLQALEAAAQSLSIPSSGVKRYIISKAGQVIGYIGNDGTVYTGLNKPKISCNSPKKDPLESVDIPKSVPNKIPKVVLSAVNQDGNPVYVRMVGNQALDLMKIIKDAKCGPPRQIKLQRFSQTYTFNTNSEVLTQNIPGFPNCDTSNPLLLSQQTSLSQPKTSSTPKTTREILPKSVEEPTYSNSSGVVAQVIESALSNSKLSDEECSSAVTASSSKPIPSSSCASLSASTRLVFSSRSTLPSIPSINPTPPPHTSESNPGGTPLIVQTENGQQLQVGLNEKLSQIVQKTGQRIVAIPNDKGGYTISLISSANSHQVQENTVEKTLSQANTTSLVRNQRLVTKPPSVAISIPETVALVRKPKVEVQPVISSQQVSHIVSNYSTDQILSTSTVGRQILIQQPGLRQNQVEHQGNVQNPSTVLTKLGSPNHIVQIAQGGQTAQVVQLAQAQPQVLQIAQQQGTQKVYQILSPTPGRQVVHVVQPGQVYMSPNSVSVMKETSNHPLPSSGHHQLNVVHHPISPPLQQHNSTSSSQPIRVQYTSENQMHQIVVDSSSTAAPSTQDSVSQLTDVLQSESHQHQLQQQQQHNTVVVQQSEQTPFQSRNLPTKSQVGRLLLIQTNEGQKVCLQLPDGKLSVLSPEQLQPFIASGAIKVNNS